MILFLCAVIGHDRDTQPVPLLTAWRTPLTFRICRRCGVPVFDSEGRGRAQESGNVAEGR
jgi:hypothetical protein